ncbi:MULTISPECIES: transcription antitermination factor NusB [Roseobacteraceae]|uniref:Transcription antitermination protein NusB n=1 Tax=Celeribacter baekdonensis B30 TaxID=1208323 RepID=K2IIL7_9RHOB|nr:MULTISPECIES: transcription antitermination factor NusB [Roseobacteraceae]EKE69981.1 transcription antitermination factor NusB [Celeribacter baekdonensis B30]KAB6717822.1 transcription antitermination factor NusB [Roseobacter sp. TSBP12]|tara:strand:+ start:1190 stop:1678 length:489 start_codon:yes stop_codon:yes gene_type:complete
MTSDNTDHLKPPSKREKKSAARLYAVQALFQMEASDMTVDKVRRQFYDFFFGLVTEEEGEFIDGDSDLFHEITEVAVNEQAKIDQMTDRALVAKWPIARIDSTLRAIFRAAGAELLSGLTPPKVVIVEFVDVAKAFYPEGRESKFVNAVLDHMAREVRPEAF